MPATPVNANPIQPMQHVVQAVSGVAQPAGRELLIDCTVAGNVVITMQSGATLTINVQANTLYNFDYAVTMVTNGTATATYFIFY